MKQTYHLHITFQPRYFDRWNDDELKNLIERVEYQLCYQFLKGRWEKYSYEDRFWGIGFWEKDRNTTDRHTHLLFHIPHHKLMVKDRNGWRKPTSTKTFMEMRISSAFRSEYFKMYPRDWLTQKNYKRAVKRYGSYETFRIIYPHIQTIGSDKKDKKKVVFYDTKELFRSDRLEDIFFTRSHRATVSKIV